MVSTSRRVMSSRGVPTHSGNQVVMGSSTPGMRPSSMAMPIRVLVKLLDTDQLVAHELWSAPSAYHSETILPWRTTTTPWVLRSGAKA